MRIHTSIIFVFLFFILPALAYGQDAAYTHSLDVTLHRADHPAPRLHSEQQSTFGSDSALSLRSQKFTPPNLQNADNESFASSNGPTKTILAVKSNLLYDALSLVNYSIEVPLGERYSMLLYHQFPWWRWGKANNQYCLRFLSLGGEVRWWFSPKPKPATERRIARDRLVGHFFGVYSESGRWDFQRRRDICHQGEFWSVGLSYGYAMPIGRRLNLELSLSAGYASIPYRGYTPSEDFQILWKDDDKVGRWSYFGLTKAQVSLVVPITAKSKKGGSR